MHEATGDLTDVPGIRVGHWTDAEGRTGCTVVLLPDEGAVTSVSVRGAAPGTRETDLLDPGATVAVAHAVVLTGGSAFGLAAADGVMRRLEERGVGVETGSARVPIVPAAVLYDLGAGSPTARPDADAGYRACRAAEDGNACGRGAVGAGTGATVGKAFGDSMPAGLGTASLHLPSGTTVAAVAAVNALGDVVAEDGSVLAGADTVARLLAAPSPPEPAPRGNTTLVLVATDAPLTKTQAHRLASVAHDGLALAVRPVHTAYDGDVVFAVSTGRQPADPAGSPLEPLALQAAAVEVVARAVRDAARQPVSEECSRDVFRLLRDGLLGRLDGERPVVDVVAVEDVTGDGEVLGVLVTYAVGDIRPVYRWADEEWDFADHRPPAMAEWLTTLIRTDIREQVDTARQA